MTANGRITIADVATAAGVSTTAVSWAINGKGTLDPGTRRHIRQVAERLGYRPSVRARNLRAGRSRSVALIGTMAPVVVGSRARLGFFLEVADAAARAALDRGYALVLVPPSADEPFIDRLDVDGALVIEPIRNHWTGASLARRGLCAVTIGQDPTPGSTMAWVTRGHSGAEVMLDHLAECGARTVAVLLSRQPRATTEEARSYYRRWARERGARPIVVEADENGGEEAGRQATRTLLTDHPDVDAIYAPIDAFALGALTAAHETGRRVPGDIRIATNYDGDRARQATPPITALDLRLDELAALAVDLLLDRVEGRTDRVSADGPPPRLIARPSTVGTRSGEDADLGGER